MVRSAPPEQAKRATARPLANGGKNAARLPDNTSYCRENHEATASASSFETPLARLLRMRAKCDPSRGGKTVRASLDCPHEKDRLSLLRTLESLSPIAGPLGLRRAAAIHRSRGRRRRARSGRRVFPRPS